MSVYRVVHYHVLCVFLVHSVHNVNSENLCNLSQEKPCAARADGESVICVCNSTYCDEFIREMPGAGEYVAYTSSKAGSRFRKSYGKFTTQTHPPNPRQCITTLHINSKKKHQRVEGFGGSITDSAGINVMSLPPHMQEVLINSYFSSHGIEYNMLRVPIGGTDFSTRYYAYNEIPANDPDLSNYTLSYEDYQYKLPIIKLCSKVSMAPVHIVGSVWAPPKWMMDFQDFQGVTRLKDEYMQTFALYFLKFLQLYAENDVQLWAITTTNEPLNGCLPMGKFQHLGWSTEKMGVWIYNNLGPTIRNSSFSEVKILAADDQRFAIPIWFQMVLWLIPGAGKYIDGVAVHAYADRFTPASMLKQTMRNYPDKFVISTEASEGITEKNFGSWKKAESYITDILEDLCNNVVGWIDWNMCLNKEGGPNWVQNYVDSPIIVDVEKQEFYKQPMFYAIGHFSKFLKRDSRRIEITNKTVCSIIDSHGVNNINIINEYNPDEYVASYDSVAFQTPNNTIVVIIHNRGPEKPANVVYGDKQATLQLEASSITTVEFSAEDC